MIIYDATNRGMGDATAATAPTSLNDAMGAFRWAAYGFAALMLAMVLRRSR